MKNAGTPLTLTLALLLSMMACQDDTDAGWHGDELWEMETVPDERPALFDEGQEKGSAWTGWYDRDNPGGTGDWELRHLQSGVCAVPTGVECRTTGWLALWETGEVVSCSANDGLLCLMADQPDGVCDHDYMVRFLCPSEVCDDGVDNDGDGVVDCQDSNCVGDPSCDEVCNDGIDNDYDGATDCQDSDCVGDPSCDEVCDDGIDNDYDGWVDCIDADCLRHSSCRDDTPPSPTCDMLCSHDCGGPKSGRCTNSGICVCL